MAIDDVAKFYEDGKDRRYKLLFAVNGGAFAIAQLLVKAGDKEVVMPGALGIRELAVGMAAFSFLTVIDIYAFGLKMRRKNETMFGLFGPVGVAVLVSIGALLVAGWTLAAVPTEGVGPNQRPSWSGEKTALVAVGAVVVYLVFVALYHYCVDPRLAKRAQNPQPTTPIGAPS